MKSEFVAPNGDRVWVEVPDPVLRRPVSERSRERLSKVKAYRQAFWREHRRAPNATELYGMLREARR